MQGKRIFISGGAGVIGKALVNKLLDKGAILFVGDLKPCPKEWKGRLRYYQGDLNWIAKEELLTFAPEIVFHLAATFERTEETTAFYVENYQHNVRLSSYLGSIFRECSSLKQCIFASSYLVYDSSLFLFETPQKTPFQLKEDTDVSPRNLCGASKFFHEHELKFIHNHNLPQTNFISARIFRVYGIGSQDIISRWIRDALHGSILKSFHTSGMFDYIFAEDVAEGLVRLASCTYSGVVNLGSGKARSVSEVLSVLKAKFPNLKIEEIKPPKPIEKPYEASQADTTLLKKLTGWTPESTLESALPQLIEYEKQHLNDPVKPLQFTKGILLTSVSKKVPMIEAVKKATAKIGGRYAIHGLDLDPHCLARYALDYFWQQPHSLSPEQIRDYCHHHNIIAIIPTRDGELEFYAKHRSWFAKEGITTMVSSENTVNTCLDKKLFADWMIEHHFPAIPTELDIHKLHTHTYVVKEQHGSGSLSLGLDLSKPAALEHSKKLKAPIFQPFLAGTEYSVDLYRDKKGSVKGCIARHRDQVVNGESQITTTIRKPELEALCTQIANKLDIYGHAIFQVIEARDKSLHVVECNLRFGGASTASIAAGLDSFYWFLLECHEASLDTYPFHRCAGELRQIRVPSDLIISMN